MKRARRSLLSKGATLAVAGFLGVPGRVFATIEEVEQAIAGFSGGVEPEAGGPLSLTTPEIAENGNSVAVAFAVESPMSDEDHVEAVMILAPENPNAAVATFHFSPQSGLAQASTRMRLAQTQEVIAVAKTSTGQFYRVANPVKVTIGGCGG